MDEDRARGADGRGEGHGDRRAADERDALAEERDRRAAVRDEKASQRDRIADARDELAAIDRGRLSDWEREATPRRQAASDRGEAASDREHAASDRTEAQADRVVSAGERAAASIDELTGVHRRDPGLVELAREIARAKRTEQPFALAFVDVDGLKETNDAHGHLAGDQLLRRVVDAMRAHLRSYDLIVRFGGDEFLCALPGLSSESAPERFALITAELVARQASISVGYAELEQSDSLDQLIERADRALREERQNRRGAQ